MSSLSREASHLPDANDDDAAAASTDCRRCRLLRRGERRRYIFENAFACCLSNSALYVNYAASVDAASAPTAAG